MSKKLAIAMFGQKRLSREGGVEIVVKELCTRMAQQGCQVTCYNRSGHHVSGAEYDDAGKTEYEGIRQKSVPTIERRGLAAVSSSAFAALYSAFGKYDVVHIHITSGNHGKGSSTAMNRIVFCLHNCFMRNMNYTHAVWEGRNGCVNLFTCCEMKQCLKNNARTHKKSIKIWGIYENTIDNFPILCYI